ncbi:MAG: response regulator transcription factor [Sneathiella sp.]|nr:response regulator transcription factor [Sneathiella sp.]
MLVVIADRHDLFRQGLVTILKELKASELELREASDFSELRSILQSEPFDLIIAGLNIFQEKGLIALTNIRQKYPDIPVLAIIENPTPKLVEDLRHCKLNGIISKSASRSSYIRALKSLLLGGSHLPPRPSKKQFSYLSGPGLFPGTLTKRQEEVLYLVSDGKSNREIADILHLSEGTVKVHMTAIFKSLDVKNRTQAMLLAQQIRDKG